VSLPKHAGESNAVSSGSCSGRVNMLARW
jgi:hypothetical protein